ncbi:MAG: para-nitrobenzyl esterase [Thermomicrobiales bacterium]|nr:para-nitrobenzyl esterase [Thermomicrobiales bacterium]
MSPYRLLLPVLALLLAAPALAAAQDATPLATPADGNGALVVHTPSGALGGVANGATTEWRGVPYAAAPVGDRRWRPPAPVDPWQGVRDATQFAEVCAQVNMGPDGGITGREDCLYLNVFVPADAPAGAGLPVMVYLHGGSNLVGGPFTNADGFVARGVIMVTVAARLGVFGYAGHPALSAEGGGPSGEYGLLDQIAAFGWVRDSIAAFGGDPANVTLSGYSAGSADGFALVASPLARGLFRQAALPTATWPEGVPIAGAEAFGLSVADAVGCAAASDIAACLRAASAEDLVLAFGLHDLQPWTGGAVLPRSPLELIGEQHPTIPLLVGSSREEAGVAVPAVGAGSPYGTAEWIRDTDALVGPERGDTARALYPPDRYDSPLWATVALYTDATFACPTRRLALAADGPVWRYLYTHQIENDPDVAKLRAIHIADEAVLWHDPNGIRVVRLINGLGPAPSPYVFTPAEEDLSARMTDAWTNFAKTGDPNGPGVPAWPRYDAAGERTLVLDTVVGEVTFYHRDECAFADALPALFPEPSPAATPAATPTS